MPHWANHSDAPATRVQLSFGSHSEACLLLTPTFLLCRSMALLIGPLVEDILATTN